MAQEAILPASFPGWVLLSAEPSRPHTPSAVMAPGLGFRVHVGGHHHSQCLSGSFPAAVENATGWQLTQQTLIL